MIVGVMLCAISGGVAALTVSLLHGSGISHALLSYPLGGMLAIVAFAALSMGQQNSGRSGGIGD